MADPGPAAELGMVNLGANAMTLRYLAPRLALLVLGLLLAPILAAALP